MLPKQRKQEIFNSFNLDEVIEYLQRYLGNDIYIPSNEFSVVAKSDKKKKRKKKKKPAPPPSVIKQISDVEMLIKSIALINGRVILKYSKGETPHWDRVWVWKKSLQIADFLESDGFLPTRQHLYYEAGTSGFHCRVYNTDSIGKIVLLENFEKVNEDLFEAMSVRQIPMPSGVRTIMPSLEKRTARLVILGCFEELNEPLVMNN
jgi:hypothetical protein